MCNYLSSYKLIKQPHIFALNMKEQIIQNINDPEMLEMLFRKDKMAFTRDFTECTKGVDTELVKFWQIRLNENVEKHPALKTGFLVVACISIATALLARLPLLLKGMNPEAFYMRNLCILIFSALATWFIIKNRITGWKNILILALPVLGLTVYMNLLPATNSDTNVLAVIHVPLFMAFIFALASISFEFKNTLKVSVFLRYCGELVIMTGLLAISGGILSGITINLFEIIGMKIGQFYIENVVFIGASVLPLVAVWLIDLYPGITDRIAPVIARIFTPLVLVSAVIYLAAIFISGTRLSENRDLLIIFNVMLLCVMAIIVFSLSELDKSGFRKLNVILLFLLTVVTLLIDVYALSAILQRLADGFTPNRTAILVSNILILVNLLLVMPGLYLAGFRGKELDQTERVISRYLPVYFIYSIVVIFIFPLVFSN